MASDSDDFNRADGGLGSEWTTHTAGGATNAALQIVGNELTGVDNDYRFSVFNAFSPTNDQSVVLTYKSNTNDPWVVNLGVRLNGSVGSLGGYLGQFNSNTGECKIVELNADAETDLTAFATYGGLSANDTIEIRVTGTTITLHKNGGSAIRSVSDATHGSGQGGVGIFMSNSVVIKMDNFVVSDLAAASSIAVISHYYNSLRASQ